MAKVGYKLVKSWFKVSQKLVKVGVAKNVVVVFLDSKVIVGGFYTPYAAFHHLHTCRDRGDFSRSETGFFV